MVSHRYSDWLVRAYNVHSKDEARQTRLTLSAAAIEELEKIKTNLIHEHLRQLDELSKMQKGLADQIEQDLMEVEKEQAVDIDIPLR